MTENYLALFIRDNINGGWEDWAFVGTTTRRPYAVAVGEHMKRTTNRGPDHREYKIEPSEKRRTLAQNLGSYYLDCIQNVVMEAKAKRRRQYDSAK